ncbi:MAG: M20/M25/M40 family metallo-hydrolase [Terriglobales bacterium]
MCLTLALGTAGAALAAPQPGPGAPRPQAAAIVHAVSAERIHATIAALVGFGTRLSLSYAGTVDATHRRGVGPARDWIAAQLRAISASTGGRLQVALDPFNVPAAERIPRPLTMTNVVATLPGTDPDDHRVFWVSGHYDSRPTDMLDPTLDAPGANDDASGVAVMLECARVLSRYQFPATIKFMAVEGEEQGLYGSAYEAHEARARHEQVVAMLNNDIVGGDNTPVQPNRNELRLFSEGVPSAGLDAHQLARMVATGMENDSSSRELARFIAQTARPALPGFHVVLEFRQDRYLRGGDHRSFNLEGYAAVRFTDFHENYDHQHQTVRLVNGRQYGDLLRYTTPAYTAQVARVNALALAALASSLPAPAAVHFAPQLEIGTTLSWTAVPGAQKYHVLLRPTAAPDWTQRLTVAGTQVHVPESKDNYIMAVSAVDASGKEGLPAIAVMGR